MNKKRYNFENLYKNYLNKAYGKRLENNSSKYIMRVFKKCIKKFNIKDYELKYNKIIIYKNIFKNILTKLETCRDKNIFILLDNDNFINTRWLYFNFYKPYYSSKYRAFVKYFLNDLKLKYNSNFLNENIKYIEFNIYKKSNMSDASFNILKVKDLYVSKYLFFNYLAKRARNLKNLNSLDIYNSYKKTHNTYLDYKYIDIF